jgi:hypothetical protein
VPTLIVLLKLARALEVDASELVGEFRVAALRDVHLYRRFCHAICHTPKTKCD